MPAIQTTYPNNITPGFVGDIANMQSDLNIISRTVDAVAGIEFGKAVEQGATDYSVDATDGATLAFVGITVRNQAVDPKNPNSYAQYDTAGIMTKGPMWVMTAAAVTVGNPLYVDVATGDFYDAAAAGRVLYPNSRWDTSTTGSDKAIVVLS